MTTKKRFTVLSQIEVEGKIIASGQVDLTDDQAAYPLQRGAIEPVAAPAPMPPAPKPAKD